VLLLNFSSTIFLFFFLPITIIGYYLIRSELKNMFLLAASLLFYAWGEPKLVLLLVASILVNYLLALRIEPRRERSSGKAYVIAMLLWNFGVLFYYKYLAFTLVNINAAFGTSISVPDIALPLGISFFTFRAVSYCLDVYWGTSAAQINPINTALYISFFPQVAMGPITRYSEFETQFKDRTVSIDSLSDGIKRIVVGLAKKVILADQLGIMVDAVFNTPDAERTMLAAWLGILGYLLQLYFDFSGYSDMAIGIGAMFGFQTPENFQYPYLSKSIVEYWARWHITLGTWLKVYLYTPVFRALHGKNILGRKISSQYADYAALAAVWLFAGIWHGAAWHYVAYGLYYCFFIILERIWENYQKQKRKRLKLKKQPQTKAQAALAHLYFFVVLIFGQLMFRVPGGGAFLPYVKTMFGLMGNAVYTVADIYTLSTNWIVMLVAVVFCIPWSVYISRLIECSEYFRWINCLMPIYYAVLFVLAISFMIGGTYQAFIYFNF